MKILVVTQYFFPENFRVNDLVSELVERKHEVTVLTGVPNYPSGRVYPGYRHFQKGPEEYGGARVIRAPMLCRGAAGNIRLALNYLSFAIGASLTGVLRLGRDFDLIFVHEPSPITVGLPALLMKRRTEAPVLFWVLDLWPESVSATGALSVSWILNLIGRLVRYVYQGCDLILAASQGFMSSILSHGGQQKQLRYFPNWAEPHFIPAPADIAPPVPLPKGFRVMFAGNIGAAQDFPSILKAAEMLRDHKDIRWIVLGSGRMEEWVRSEIARKGLEGTVHLLGQHPSTSMPSFFAHADAMLISLRPDPIFSLTVPAKLQAYFACGRPVIGMLEGEGARVIQEAKAGLTCPPGEPEALAQAVLSLYKTPKPEREEMGRNGYDYGVGEFDRRILMDRLDSWMNEVVTRDHAVNNNESSTRST